MCFDNFAGSFPPENSHDIDKEISYVWNINNIEGKETFLEKIKNRLPKYQPLFKETEKRFNINWRLLAAVSYQESHWDPEAISKSGVRGLMMLTQETSKEVGVIKRTDPKQSIDGGALYLQKIYARLPNTINDSDKTWISLVAYNIGYGHLLDALKVTKLLGKDPNLWSDVKEILPLLSEERYYSFTRFGYFPGKEVKDYVENIRVFYQTLVLQKNIKT
jgi:membrane-bound lytic murein transglycosylase F